jgi:hypothetical protein
MPRKSPRGAICRVTTVDQLSSTAPWLALAAFLKNFAITPRV